MPVLLIIVTHRTDVPLNLSTVTIIMLALTMVVILPRDVHTLMLTAMMIMLVPSIAVILPLDVRIHRWYASLTVPVTVKVAIPRMVVSLLP